MYILAAQPQQNIKAIDENISMTNFITIAPLRI